MRAGAAVGRLEGGATSGVRLEGRPPLRLGERAPSSANDASRPASSRRDGGATGKGPPSLAATGTAAFQAAHRRATGTLAFQGRRSPRRSG
ncbi:MAG TPA: hypothetical protein VH599_10135 [Ktedonobacterales bacterium]